LEAALDLVRLRSPGEPEHLASDGLEGGVSSAVVFEGGSGAVGLPAVELDDEVVRRPAEVDLEVGVVGGGEGEVDQRLWQARVADEAQEPGLELAAGPLGVLAEIALARAPVPRCPFDLARRSVIARWS
jgi:hypothetical protein